MDKMKINSIYFEKLKGLKNVKIVFDKNLTAIMGVNGCGKTTVIHALACVFKPESNGDNYAFSYFFTPNSDSSWSNSKMNIVYSYQKGKAKINVISREYHKISDRWAPRYENRPMRDVYYIGIESCLPEIERQKQTSFIKYTTYEKDDKISEKILKAASYILNKNYAKLTVNKTRKKNLNGVRVNSLTYSSLSMGTGEQRVFKILQILFESTAYSMILVDEIDLLLHVTALKKLIEILSIESKKKNLQIIFTTHSLIMDELRCYVDIRYLEQTNQKTLVYNFINTDMIYSLTGQQLKPIKIYVEDILSQTIIKSIASSLNMRNKINTHIFGSASNAFTLASSFILKDDDISNTLIVIDGDVYSEEEEKLRQIQSSLSGTEMDVEEKQRRAISIIKQYSLPKKGLSPERYIFNMITNLSENSYDENNEIIRIAKTITAVNDEHKWINEIINRIDDDPVSVLKDVIALAMKSTEWQNYINNIYEWLLERFEL